MEDTKTEEGTEAVALALHGACPVERLVNAVQMLRATQAGGVIPWVHNIANQTDIEKLRRICSAYADVGNNYLWPAMQEVEQMLAERKLKAKPSIKEIGHNRLRMLERSGLSLVPTDSKLHLDVSMEQTRALHRIWRALNDGDCPACHRHTAATNVRRTCNNGIQCPSCFFQVTGEEIDEIETLFAPAMDAAMEIFKDWRNMRLGRTASAGDSCPGNV